MDALATRGHIILDDAQVRLRTGGAAQRFTDLFALKADSSTVSTGLGERPTATAVTAVISAAIEDFLKQYFEIFQTEVCHTRKLVQSISNQV